LNTVEAIVLSQLVINDVTGACEEPDFCSSSEFLSISATEGNACAAQYPDYFTDFSSTCKSRNDYSFTCNQGTKKPEQPDPDPDPDPDPETPDPDNGNGETPDPDNGNGTGGNIPSDGGNPTYTNGGNNTGSGSSGGTASTGDLSVNINFDGVHNRLDALNKNAAATNERIETTNNILNGLDKNLKDGNSKLDGTLKGIDGTLKGIDGKLGELANGTKTNANGATCTSFSCDGNAYECFVARQAWKNNCLIESLTGDDLVPREGVPVDVSQQVSDAGDALISDLKKHSVDPDKLSNGEIVISDALNEFDESNGLSFDEKCPAPHVVDTGVGIMTIDYTPFCDLALYVRAMLMLFASIGSILMIAKFS